MQFRTATNAINLIGGGQIQGATTLSGQLVSPDGTRTLHFVNDVLVIGGSDVSTPLQQWQNPTGTSYFTVDNDGNLQLGQFTQTNKGGGHVNIGNPAGDLGSIGLVMRAIAGQTGDLAEWLSAAGAVMLAISPTGVLTAHNQFVIDENGNVQVGAYTAAAKGPGHVNLQNAAADAGTPDLVIRAATGQTASLSEWLDNTGAVLIAISPTGVFAVRNTFTVDEHGNVQYGIFTDANQGPGHVNIGNTAGDLGSIPLVVRALATQTAHQQEWQSSAGAAVAYITAGGNVAGTGAYTTLSDVAVKDNVAPVVDPVAVVRALRPVHFDYIDGEPDQVGFIAQDVEQVLPAAVVPFDTDRLGVRSEAILAYLVAAVQTLLPAAA